MNPPSGAGHLPVLPAEVLEVLDVQPDGIYVDCTAGRGGHSEIILGKLGAAGRLLALDRDPEAIAALRQRFSVDPRVTIAHASHDNLERLCSDYGWHGVVSGVLFDLGASSPQFDNPERGFSFQHDGPLDMRFDNSGGQDAATWLSTAAETEIADVLHHYGEERHARRVARAIVRERAVAPITRTGRLRDIVAAAIPGRERDRHPATRAFQAIRIQINGELAALSRSLPQALAVLRAGGRMAVISFHSLEDRIVKRYLRSAARGDDYPPDLPVPATLLNPRLRLLGRARRPGDDEIARNPRARSAVLRAAAKVAP